MRPLLARLDGMEPAAGADLFHGTLAAALADWAAWAAESTGVRRMVLCGGCFFNKVMSARLAGSLTDLSLGVLHPVRLGPGDRAISLGQAWATAMNKG